jgi:hypothetical protein
MDSIEDYFSQSTAHVGLGNLFMLADILLKNPLRDSVCSQDLQSNLCQGLQHAGNFSNGYLNAAFSYMLVQGTFRAIKYLSNRLLPEENLFSKIINFAAEHDIIASMIGTGASLFSVYYAETQHFFGTPDNLDMPAGYIGALAFGLLYLPLKPKICSLANKIYSSIA